MYFIPRNNRFYNYIAHTSSVRRYVVTIAIIGTFFIVSAYCVYYPLLTFVTVYNIEYHMLQKKYAELAQLDKSIKEFGLLIDSKKNIIQTNAISSNGIQHCYEQIIFILETITRLGLSLHSYNISKEKDKKWYVKNSASFEMSGNKEKLMTFLNDIKKSQKMIILSNIVLTQKTDNLFHMNCEAAFISIKNL